MKNRTFSEITNDTITTDTPGLMRLTNSGRATATEIGRAAKAQIRIGRKILWNVAKIRRYLDAISE